MNIIARLWVQIPAEKKMTMEQFVHNNRGINQDADLPQEFLQSIYMAIDGKEIRMLGGAEEDSLTLDTWQYLAEQSRLERTRPPIPPAALTCATLRAATLTACWPAALGALGGLLRSAESRGAVEHALHGHEIAARMFAHAGLHEAIDALTAQVLVVVVICCTCCCCAYSPSTCHPSLSTC